MSQTPDAVDYAFVLKDLEAKRALIDAAIATVRPLVGLSLPGAAGPAQAAQSGEPMSFGEHPFLGMSIGEAAKKYLLMTKRKQTVKEIAEGLERGGLHHVSTNFPATVATMISRYAKTDDDMLSTGRGEWALAAWYGNRRPKVAEAPKKRKGKTKGPSKTRSQADVATSSPAEPSARELTVQVLKAAGKPLQVNEIISHIEAVSGRKIAKPTLVSMLSGYVKAQRVFTRPAPSTFGLMTGQ